MRRLDTAMTPSVGLAWPAGMRAWLRQMDRQVRRWLVVPLEESVSVAPSLRNSPVVVPGAVPEYPALLQSWRRVVVGWRLLAVARRSAILAVTITAVLILASRLSALPWPVAPAAGVVVLLAGLVIGLTRTPALQPVVHFLDRQLNLHDQLSTALELAPEGGPEDTIYNRLHRRSAGLAQAYRQTWHVRPAAATGEWAGLAVLLLLLGTGLFAPRPAVLPPRPLASGSRGVTVSANAPPHQVKVSVSTIPSTRSPAPPPAPRPSTSRSKTSARAGTTGHTSRHSHQPPPSGNGASSGALTRSSNAGNASSGNKNSHGLPFLKGGSSSGKNGGQAPARGSGTQRPQHTGKHASATSGAATAPRQKPGHVRGKLLHSHSPGGSGQSGGQSTKGQSRNKAGGTSPTKQKSPYGGPLPFLHSLPKPGLITGKSFSANTHNKGSNSAGHSAGAKNGPHATRPRLGTRNGKSISLHSGYAHGPGHGHSQSSSIPGKRGGTARVRGASLGAQAIDYVPSDPNQVPAGQSGAVSRYFTPPTEKTRP